MAAPTFQLIASPHERIVINLIQQAKEALFISAPYIKSYGVEMLLANAKIQELSLLTNLSLENITGASFDFDALLALWDHFHVKVSSLEKLHAKIYVADSNLAFITSANLTRGGLRENYEYGILIRDQTTVHALQTDMARYFSLGNVFEQRALLEIQEDILEIKRLKAKLEQMPKARKLREVLESREENVQTKLLANRIRKKTINSIFSETILYLLQRHGSLTTQQLHAFIKEIHPDICDDTIDRVINGQHFGKKWKHMVRNAQQYLKSKGLITLANAKWRLTQNRVEYVL